MPVRNIVIVGGGVTGWSAAAGIANSLRGQAVSIVVLDSGDGSDAPGTQLMLWQTPRFHRYLGIDEHDIVRAANATFRLGTQLTHWPSPGEQRQRPFGPVGANIGFIPFHHFATRQRRNGHDIEINDYSVSAAAARLGHFSHPGSNSRSLLSRLSYGLNLDARGYARLLSSYAQQLGVEQTSADLSEVSQRNSDGFIEALTLTDGQRIEGDLFVDCSGERGLLIEAVLHSGYEDWSEWLPCDRVVGIRSCSTEPPASMLHLGAGDAGWVTQTPLQGEVSRQYVFSSQYLDDDQALHEIGAMSGSGDRADRWQYSVRNGHRKQFWNKNCIALGAAAGAFEPLEMTGLHLVQTGLTRLLGMLPGADCNPVISEEYNRRTAREYARIRDYLAFNYFAADQRPAPFWQALRSMSVPDSLHCRLQLFESHGRFTRFEQETFLRDNWASLFIGGGCWPRDYDPLLDMTDPDEATRHFAKMRTAIHDTVGRLPQHGQYIEEFCRQNDSACEA